MNPSITRPAFYRRRLSTRWPAVPAIAFWLFVGCAFWALALLPFVR